VALLIIDEVGFEPSGGQPLLPTKSRSMFAGAAQQADAADRPPAGR